MGAARWIMYTHQDGPPQTSFDLTVHASLKYAKAYYESYCRVVHSNECSSRLYPFTDEDWADALDFKDIGCPFDYPSKIIERGPKGGIKVTNA